MAALAVCLSACDNGPSDIDDILPTDLAATWTANAACAACTFTFTSVADPELSLDALDPPLSETVTLTLNRNGTASLSMLGAQVLGSARVEGSTLILSRLGSADTIDYTVSGNTLTLDFRGTFFLVDFTGDEVADAATMFGVLTRQ